MSLQVSDLKVYYRTLAGDVKALDGATFSIADKEIMGLAGESGCGKSTLGNSLIRLDGRNPTRKIGKMIGDLLESRGESYKEIKPELMRRIDLVGLQADVLGRYPIELSGGMKQRMVMVISTLLDPSLLIADEITSALDVSTQRAVAETLVSFRDHGFVKSMLVITHDVSILYQTADTILVMYAGKLAEKAPTKTIIEQPRHPYTTMLISSLPEVGVRYANKKLSGIPGSPPSLLNPPTGCRFRARCPLAFDKCLEEPPFIRIAPDHSVACWKVDGSDA